MLEYDINNGLIPRKKTEHRERNETVLRRNGLQENSKKKNNCFNLSTILHNNTQ